MDAIGFQRLNLREDNFSEVAFCTAPSALISMLLAFRDLTIALAYYRSFGAEARRAAS
jgi:hypothetical protein